MTVSRFANRAMIFKPFLPAESVDQDQRRARLASNLVNDRAR
jgi:hypothetical protein